MAQRIDVCVPSQPRGACASCARRSLRRADPRWVTLDASAIEPSPVDCRMWVDAGPAPRVVALIPAVTRHTLPGMVAGWPSW